MTMMTTVNHTESDAAVPPVHHAEDLVGPSKLAHIQLGDQTYILRITRAGKLILTK
nr:hemin uptake protein HemP [Chachezhania antarctica]